MSKPFLRGAAITIFGIYALYALVLAPVYEIIASNITLMGTLWFDLVDLLLQWTEILGGAVMMAFILVGIHRTGSAKKAKPLLYLAGGALLFKYVATIIAISIVYGSFDATMDFGSYILSLLLEAAPCALLAFLTHRLVAADRIRRRELANAAFALGQEQAAPTPLLPFSKLFAKDAPLQRVLYICIGVLCALRALSFILSEIAFSLIGYGFTAADIPVILLYFFLLVLLPCFLAYLLAYLVIRRLSAKSEDAAA